MINDFNTWTRLEWGNVSNNYYLQIIPTWGFYIGVQLDGINNDLFYSTNVNLVNGQPIGKITIRNLNGIEQVFLNEEFIFHIDGQQSLGQVQLSAANGDEVNFDFEIHTVRVSTFE